MLTLFILISLVLFNKIIYKSYLNPIFLQSLLWAVYYTFLLLNIDFFSVGINKLNNYVLLQSMGFSVGGFFCFLFAEKKSVSQTLQPRESKLALAQENIDIFYPYITAILVFALIGVFIQNGSLSILKIADLRNDLTDDDGKKYGLWGFLHSIILVYIVVLITAKKKLTISYKVLIVLFFYLTLMLGGKGPLVFFGCAIMYVLIWQKRIKKIVLVYGLVAIIWLMGLLTNLRFGDSEVRISDNDVLRDALLTYALASIPALEIAPQTQAKTFGFHTFRVLYIWINKLGFDYPTDNMLSKYTNTPLPTNTYSYIKPYYYDFGYAGIFILPMLLGIMHNSIYFKAKKGSLVATILSGLLLTPLLLQFLEEQYFRWLSSWVYFIFLIFLITKVKFYNCKFPQKTQLSSS